MLMKIEKISRRLSRVSTVHRLSALRNYNYKSSTVVPPEESHNTKSSCAESSNGNSNGYKHFEIVSLDENCSETTFNSQQTESSIKRKPSKLSKVKSFQKQRRAKRENRAIFMTFFVSISYLICYMEIINFYTLASFTDSPRTLFDKVLGIKGHSIVETYVYLWYYYSLFVAATTNVVLHFLFNHVVRNGLTVKGRKMAKNKDDMNPRSSVRSCTINGNKWHNQFLILDFYFLTHVVNSLLSEVWIP